MTVVTREVSSIIESFCSRKVPESLECAIDNMVLERLRVRHLMTVIPSATMTSTPNTGLRIKGSRLVVTCPQQFTSREMERHTPARS